MEVRIGGLKVIIGMILPREHKRSAFLNRSGTSSEIWGKKTFFLHEKSRSLYSTNTEAKGERQAETFV